MTLSKAFNLKIRYPGSFAINNLKTLLKRAILSALPDSFQEKLKFILRKNKAVIRGHNNNIVYSHARLSNVSIEINGSDNEISFGSGSVISNLKVHVDGSNHKLCIGKDCRILSGHFFFLSSRGSIVVGDKTFVNTASFVCSESAPIWMGNNCMLAWDIEIHSGDAHRILDRATNCRVNPAKEVRIGNHVWIGAHVNILKGVSIGENSIIGANSVVTHDIPSNCMAAGIPARIIKENIYWEE